MDEVIHLFAEREEFNGHLKDDKTKQLEMVICCRSHVYKEMYKAVAYVQYAGSFYPADKVFFSNNTECKGHAKTVAQFKKC